MALTKIGKEGVTGISNSSDATAITIDSSENVGIGTADTALFNSEATSAKLTVAGSDTSTTTIGNGDAAINISQLDGTAGNTSGLHFSRQNSDGNPNYAGASIVAQFPEARVTGQYPKGVLAFLTSTATNSAPSEKMRIDSSGDLLVGATSTSNLGGINPKLIVQNTSDGIAIQEIGNGYVGLTTKASGAHNYYAAYFENSTPAKVGGIYCSTTSTSFQTSSDYRLKENVTATWDATTRLKQLNPVRFNFIADASITVDGCFAHEVQTVVPEAIGGTHNEVETWTQQQIDDGDAPDGTSAGDNKLDGDGNTIPVYQGIDQSKLVPLLCKTIQELEARITALENA